MGVTGWGETMSISGELHVICGKIAAGKSTLAAELGQGKRAVILPEDAWLHALYGGEMRSVADYLDRAARLREIAGPLATRLLQGGSTVILDFAANRPEERGWMRGLAEAAGARAVLHYLDVEDATCLERLKARNARGGHPFKVSEAQFWQITRAFVPPREGEGFEIIRYDLT